MRLNLREYTDPDKTAIHALNYIETWKYVRYLNETDNWELISMVENEAQEHLDWLLENVPWLVPHLDAEIIHFLRPKDLVL